MIAHSSPFAAWRRICLAARHGINALLLLGTAGATAGWSEEEILVANGNGITVHRHTASGNVAPLRRLQGTGTGIQGAAGVAVDAVNGEILVADSSGKAIQVFLRDAGGNVAPVRTIKGPATQLCCPFGIAVDPVHDEIVVADSGGVGNILVFPRKAHGNVAPLRAFTFIHQPAGPQNCLCPIGVVVDTVNDEIIVTTDISILTFPRTASGTQFQPLRRIEGLATGLDFPEGVFLNTAANEIVVAQTSNFTPSIRFYGRTATGNVAPLRTIAGALTGLAKPVGLDVSLARGEIIVSNLNDGSVATFALGASGNVPPLRTIKGALTQVGNPSLIALAPDLSPGPAVLHAAVLPSGRSVRTGTAASAFATLINTGAAAATSCQIAQVTPMPLTFDFRYVFQTTSQATNQPIGTPNTPVDIPPGGFQTFVFAFTPLSATAVAPIDVQLAFHCSNTARAPSISGLNTLLFSASPTPIPDIVALAATLGNDGVVDIPGAAGTGVFAVATVNVGAPGSITVSADTGLAAAAATEATLPLNVAVCQTEPSTGQCLAPPGPSVAVAIGANETPTFGVFVTGSGSVAFDPAVNRVVVRFRDAQGVVRGATSVAARTN